MKKFVSCYLDECNIIYENIDFNRQLLHWILFCVIITLVRDAISKELIMKSLLKPLLVFPLLILSACESVDSDDVRTSGLFASYKVEAHGGGNTRIRARFRVGGPFSNTNLKLKGGDQLVVSANGSSVVMRKDSEFLGGTEYKANFVFDTENTEFVIAFNRSTGTSAPNSYVNMPAPVNFTSPVAGQTFSRSSMIEIAWTPVSNNMSSIRVHSLGVDCLSSNGEVIDRASSNLSSDEFMLDPGGTSRVASTYLSAAVLDDPGATCVMTLQVIREQKGVLDSAFGEGGGISAKRYDTVEINVVP